MENKLAENIRSCRKNLGLTQEQLAERLGITLGTVSKWERGSSEPDLGFLMELAGLFHVSVDALIGFSLHGTDADEEADRIEALVAEVSFEELAAEYESALKRFPNHFRLVFGAAGAHRRIGAMLKKDDELRRALVLFRHAVGLISQNTDPSVNEVCLRNEIAGCYTELKDYKKAVEEYKKNNLSGNNDAMIGLIMIQYEKNMKEGIEFSSRAFLNILVNLSDTMSGYIRYYLEIPDLVRGLRAAEWTIRTLENMKENPEKPFFLDKIICLYYLCLAAFQHADGQVENAGKSLLTAFRIAREFDSNPVYSLENTIFTEHTPPTVYVYDNSGPTAVEGPKGTLEEIGKLASDAFRELFDREYSRSC